MKLGFKSVIKQLCCLLAIMSLGTTVLAGPEITVDATTTLGPVKKYVLGHNVESADPRGIFGNTFDAKTFDTQYIKNAEGFWDPVSQKPCKPVVDMAKTTGMTILRYPGGCYASNFDWRKAVGPLAGRGDWRFGLNEYVELCRALGAEPLITCSDYVLPAEEMPAHLAAMVEYLNAPATPEHPWAMKRKAWGHPEPFGVKWFELGNESGAGNYYCKPRRKFTSEAYSDYANKCAAAMRKIDPSIKIGIQYEGKDALKFADFVIIHHYGAKINGQDIKENFKSAMAHVEHYERRIAEVAKSIRENAGRDIPIALTEYNIYYFNQKPVPYRFSAMAGLFCADMVRMLLQPKSSVEIANYWQIANGYFGMIVSKDGNIKQLRAPLAFYQLWGGHFGGSLLPIEVKNSPYFEAPAAEDTPLAKGDGFVAAVKRNDVDLRAFNFKVLKEVGVEANSPDKQSLNFKLNALAKPCYINFGYFANSVKGSDLYYKMSFESRFVPEAKGIPSGNLGLSLLDARGWQATNSAVAVDGIEMDADWKAHSVNFTPKKDCSGIQIVFRAPNVARPLSGTLEVRNFKIETWTPPSSPAYQGLTASSSLASDGKTLHLIVFNKSYDTAIISTVNLKGFVSRSATSWIAGDKPEALEYKAPVKTKVSLPPSGQPITFQFPAHSMTAIDFVRE